MAITPASTMQSFGVGEGQNINVNPTFSGGNFLMVVLCHGRDTNVTQITWGGVAIPLVSWGGNPNGGYVGLSVYGLKNYSPGTRNLVINVDGWSPEWANCITWNNVGGIRNASYYWADATNPWMTINTNVGDLPIGIIRSNTQYTITGGVGLGTAFGASGGGSGNQYCAGYGSVATGSTYQMQFVCGGSGITFNRFSMYEDKPAASQVIWHFG